MVASETCVHADYSKDNKFAIFIAILNAQMKNFLQLHSFRILNG